MKKYLLFSILFSFPIWAQDPAQAKKEIEEKVKADMEFMNDAATKITGGVVQVQEDKRIEKLIGDSALYPKCNEEFKKQFSANPNPSSINILKIDACSKLIKINDDGSPGAGFDDLVKNLKITMYQTDGAVLQTSKNYFVIKEYMEQRLQEKLYGDDKTTYDYKSHGEDKRKVGTVDHEVFYDLYKTQLTKSFLLDVGAYCSENYMDKSSDYDATKETTYKQKITDDKTQIQSLGDGYMKCINSLGCQCYGDKIDKYCKNKDGTLKDTVIPNIKEKACNLVTRLRQMKFQIKELDKTKDDFAKLSSKDHIKSTNVEYDRMAENKTIDDITTFTSGNYDDAIQLHYKKLKQAGDKLVLDSEKKNLNNCQLQNGKELDSTNCKEINTIEKDKLAEINLQERLRTELLQAQLNKVSDATAMKEYLKEQKLTDDEIKKILPPDVDLTTLKKEMAEKLKAEREAIITEINNKMNKESVIVDQNKVSQADKSQIQDIAMNKEERTKRLIHYTNVVSAYFKVCLAGDVACQNGNGNTKAYTKSLKRELAEASNDIKNVNDHAYFNKLKTETSDQIKNGSQTEGSSMLGMDFINQILGED